MNLNIIRQRLQRMDRVHAVVLVGSTALTTSTFFLRLGLSGDLSPLNLMISGALLGWAFGLMLLVHSRAKPLEQARQEKRAYDALLLQLETVRRRCAELKNDQRENDAKLHKAAADEELRRIRNFNLSEKRAWAVSRVLTGYHWVINTNNAPARFGGRRTA